MSIGYAQTVFVISHRNFGEINFWKQVEKRREPKTFLFLLTFMLPVFHPMTQSTGRLPWTAPCLCSVIACEHEQVLPFKILEAFLSGAYIAYWPLPPPWKSWPKIQENNVFVQAKIYELGLFLHFRWLHWYSRNELNGLEQER